MTRSCNILSVASYFPYHRFVLRSVHFNICKCAGSESWFLSWTESRNVAQRGKAQKSASNTSVSIATAWKKAKLLFAGDPFTCASALSFLDLSLLEVCSSTKARTAQEALTLRKGKHASATYWGRISRNFMHHWNLSTFWRRERVGTPSYAVIRGVCQWHVTSQNVSLIYSRVP